MLVHSLVAETGSQTLLPAVRYTHSRMCSTGGWVEAGESAHSCNVSSDVSAAPDDVLSPCLVDRTAPFQVIQFPAVHCSPLAHLGDEESPVDEGFHTITVDWGLVDGGVPSDLGTYTVQVSPDDVLKRESTVVSVQCI